MTTDAFDDARKVGARLVERGDDVAVLIGMLGRIQHCQQGIDHARRLGHVAQRLERRINPQEWRLRIVQNLQQLLHDAGAILVTHEPRRLHIGMRPRGEGRRLRIERVMDEGDRRIDLGLQIKLHGVGLFIDHEPVRHQRPILLFNVLP